MAIEEARSRADVIRDERAWHDQEAHRRVPVDSVLYRPPAFDAVVQTALTFLQSAPGTNVLDAGSGEGKETLALAQAGYCVISADLSLTQLRRTRAMIAQQAPDACVLFVQASAEELPFAAGSFPLLYGKAILHHLDLDIAYRETERLLAPGGRASYAEPLARHPLIRLGRNITPQLRTRDERPLRFEAFSQWAARFDASDIETFFLLAPAAYPLRLMPGGEKLFQTVHRWLARVDAALFRRWPSLRRLAWYGVVKLSK